MNTYLFQTEPTLTLICKQERGNYQLFPTFTAKCKNSPGNYQLVPEFTVECRCPSGTEWDEECQDCVPVCFDQFLEYLNNWNSSFSL